MLLDLLFPRKCLGCGRRGGYFCSQCLESVDLKRERICPVCGDFSLGGQTHPGCVTAWSLDGLTSIFSYEGLIKKAIKKLKYRFVSDLAGDLVELFLSFCGEDKAFSQLCRRKDLLFVPIPLHLTRLRWRGFNQAELLGRMIASNLNLAFIPNLLKRNKKTVSQAELSRSERLNNMKNAFSIEENFRLEVRNRDIILFDDVWTSGATMREAGKVLKRSGVKKVWGLTLAR